MRSKPATTTAAAAAAAASLTDHREIKSCQEYSDELGASGKVLARSKSPAISDKPRSSIDEHRLYITTLSDKT